MLTLSLSAIPSVALAKEKPGASCTGVGKISNLSGAEYKCTKIGKRLTWVKSTAAGKTANRKTTQTPLLATPKLKQIINVPLIKSVDITAGIFIGSFSTNSNLPVTLSTNTPLICDIKNQSISVLQTGNCAISANQPGNDKYLPAEPVSFSFEVKPPTVTSDNSLLDQVQTFIRVPMGTTFTSDTAEITLKTFSSDATAKVCANDASALGCTLINGAGAADPTSQTRYVEFALHIKNLDANPLPTISYRLLLNGTITDINSGVTLETLNNLSIGSGESADGSLFGVVPNNLKLEHAYLVIDEGITNSSTRLLLNLSN